MEPTPQTLSESLIDRLNSLSKKNLHEIELELSRLKRDAEKLLNVNPFVALMILGGIARIKGEYELMVKHHKSALTYNPTDYHALYNYATSLAMSWNYSGATEQYLKILANHAPTVEVLNMLIQTFVLAGSYVKAKHALDKYSENSSEDNDALRDDVIKMNNFIKSVDIQESEIEQYAELMNNIMSKHNIYPERVELWVTDDEDMVRNVVIKANSEQLFKYNDELIENLSQAKFSNQMLLNFTGYFVSDDHLLEVV